MTVSPLCTVRSESTAKQRPYSNLRRALSFDDDNEDDNVVEGGDDVDVDDDVEVEDEDDVDVVIGSGKLPVSCLWEVLRRLPPPSLLSAAKVCKGWRDVSKRLWKAAEELRLRVPAKTQVGFVGSVLQKCPALIRLSLTMERFENISDLGFRYPIGLFEQLVMLYGHKLVIYLN